VSGRLWPAEPECNPRTARSAIAPVAHNLRRDRALLIDLEREAGRELRRVVIIVRIERIPIAEGNGVPSYGSIEVEISANAQDVIWKVGTRVLAPMLAEPSTAEDRKGAID
jgi:hypothetical protein